MSSHKKRKLSGLSNDELSIAYETLQDLRRAFEDERLDVDEQAEDGGSASVANDQVKEQLKGILSFLRSRLEGPKSYNLSKVTLDVLESHLHITQASTLFLKDELSERTEHASHLGKDKVWSSSHFNDHLTWLEGLVPRTSQANARSWVDAFFFRASAMVPSGMRMVLNMEHTIPSTAIHPTSLTTLAGQIDYSAVVAQERFAAAILDDPLMSTIRRILPTGFFVAEAKPGELRSHLAQAVAEMYGTAKVLEKNVLRGALTNGHDWIFLILNLNLDGDGATFKGSITVPLYPRKLQVPVVKSSADLIAGILSFWIEHSFNDLSEDDWFQDDLQSTIS